METDKDNPSSTSPAPTPPICHQTTAWDGLREENGHSLRRIQPMSRHSGESVSTFLNGLFTTIIGIATLGASVTFSYVISNQTPSTLHASGPFSPATVQDFLSISWLLFLLVLAFASLFSTLLTFFKEHWKADWDGRNGDRSRASVQLYASVTIAVLGGLVIAAFIFLCLVVIAYSPVVGCIALAFTAAFGLIIFISMLYHAPLPWPWRDNSPVLKTEMTA